MITGELKNKVDKLWTTFWNNGISNPLAVIEQITYLVFMKRLDDSERAGEARAKRGGKHTPLFTPGQQSLRWSKLLHQTGDDLLQNARQAFELVKGLHGDAATTAYARHMKDAIFMVSKASLLQSAVEQIEQLPWGDQDEKGDLYEYMLGKLATAGTNGQFRTPRHIIRMMVALRAPTLDDTILDPACGTAGFLVGAADHLKDALGDALYTDARYPRFRGPMFVGFDFDATMLRIGTMNLVLHGIENPSIDACDALSTDAKTVDSVATLVLANPPFKGSVDMDGVAEDLLSALGMQRAKRSAKKAKDASDLGKDKKGPGAKTELLFLAQMLRALKVGGRAAVIVPDGVLFGPSKAHVAIRKALVQQHLLEGIVSMPSGVFRPYASVSTAVLLFTKTGAGGTEHVWFYDMSADGYSLDDKRQEVDENDIPDLVARWAARDPRKDKDRTAKHFMVPIAEIAAKDFELSINRYKEARHEAVAYESPKVIIAKLRALEAEIARELGDLEVML